MDLVDPYLPSCLFPLLISNLPPHPQCDSREQLRNVQQIRVVQYRYTDEFARHAGLGGEVNTGVIAQEVKHILPEAVSTAGDVVLDNGTKLDNFLVVDRVRGVFWTFQAFPLRRR